MSAPTGTQRTAMQIYEALPRPTSWADVMNNARTIIREAGDLPEGIWYEMWYGQPWVPFAQAARELSALRPIDAPPYVGGWL
jgi:hypothetical protein